MSDLHEPDLDRAFAALTSGLAARSSAPGASVAIATARRRRRTRGGAVALVAAAAVAAVVVPQLVGGSDGSSVAGSRELPAAAALSVESLTAATDGWVGAWQPLDETNAGSLDGLDSPCLGAFGGPDASPTRMGDQAFVGEGGAAAIAVYLDYDTPSAPAEYESAFLRGMAECGASVSDSVRGGAAVTHGSTIGTVGRGVDEVWFARLGDRVAVFAVLGSSAQAPAGVTEAVTDLVLGAVQEDASYAGSSGIFDMAIGGGSSSATAAGYPDIPLSRIRAATGAWSRGWTAGTPITLGTLPCYRASLSEPGIWTQESTLGERGTLTFGQSDDAGTAITQLLDTLSTCNSARWTVRNGLGAHGTAAWASYEGGSIFLAEAGGGVASLQVIGLGVPSDEVATRIIGILEQALANPTS